MTINDIRERYHRIDGTITSIVLSRRAVNTLNIINFRCAIIGLSGWVNRGTKQAFEIRPCHEPRPAQLGGGDDLVGDPAPDGPDRCPRQPSDVGGAQILATARHDSF